MFFMPIKRQNWDNVVKKVEKCVDSGIIIWKNSVTKLTKEEYCTNDKP